MLIKKPNYSENKQSSSNSKNDIKKKRAEDIIQSQNSLKDIIGVTFDNLKAGSTQETKKKGTINITQNKSECNEEAIQKVAEANDPDPAFVFRKDFLDLDLSERELHNNIDYKKKLLYKKIHREQQEQVIVFNNGLLSEMKNFIFNKIDYDLFNGQNYFKINETVQNSEKSEILDCDDNQNILDLCLNIKNINDFIKEPVSNVPKVSLFKNTVSKNIVSVQNNTLIKSKQKFNVKRLTDSTICFNVKKKEVINQEIIQFFENYIKEHKFEQVSSKVRLMLDSILAISDKTGNPILSISEQNSRLEYWYNLCLEKMGSRYRYKKK